jgi:hypothetical protein
MKLIEVAAEKPEIGAHYVVKSVLRVRQYFNDDDSASYQNVFMPEGTEVEVISIPTGWPTVKFKLLKEIPDDDPYSYHIHNDAIFSTSPILFIRHTFKGTKKEYDRQFLNNLYDPE